jgi:hypothetical protein
MTEKLALYFAVGFGIAIFIAVLYIIIDSVKINKRKSKYEKKK